MKKFIFTPKSLFTVYLPALTALLILTSCSVSKDKIAEAQSKYRELVSAHNAVVEAHKEIKDSSLDEELGKFEEKLDDLLKFDLNSMKTEDIDSLISSMGELLDEYKDYLVKIEDIRTEETARVLTVIPLTLKNDTDITFISLALKEVGDDSQVTDILDAEHPFAPSNEITGLNIHRDVDNTPWLLIMTDSEGNSYEFPINSANYDENGDDLILAVDEMSGEITLLSGEAVSN